MIMRGPTDSPTLSTISSVICHSARGFQLKPKYKPGEFGSKTAGNDTFTGGAQIKNMFIYEKFYSRIRYKNTTVQGRFFGIQKVQKLLFCDQVEYWKEKIHNRLVPLFGKLETWKVLWKWRLVRLHKCKRSKPRYFNKFFETVKVFLGRGTRHTKLQKLQASKQAQKWSIKHG